MPDRQPPCQNPPAEPVHHRNQIHKPLRHRDVRDVRAPHLVRPVDDQTPQQIRVHLVFRDDAGWCWASGRSPPAPSPASVAARACGSPPSRRAATPPPSAAIHRTVTPDTARPSAASPPDHPHSPAPAGNTASSARPSAAGIAPRSTGPGQHGPPAPAVRPGSWTRPFAKKIALHRQLADLLIQRRQLRLVRRGASFAAGLASREQRRQSPPAASSSTHGSGWHAHRTGSKARLPCLPPAPPPAPPSP